MTINFEHYTYVYGPLGLKSNIMKYSISKMIFLLSLISSISCGDELLDTQQKSQNLVSAGAEWSDKELFAGIALGLGPVAPHLPSVRVRYERLRATQDLSKKTKDDVADDLRSIADSIEKRGGNSSIVVSLRNLSNDSESLSRTHKLMTAPIDEYIDQISALEISDLDVLFDDIENIDPGFLDRFAQDVKSGSHVKVSGAVLQASRIMEEIRSLAKDNLFASSSPTPTPECIALVPVIAITIAATIAAAFSTAAVAANVLVYIAVGFWSPGGEISPIAPIVANYTSLERDNLTHEVVRFVTPLSVEIR